MLNVYKFITDDFHKLKTIVVYPLHVFIFAYPETSR